MIQKNNMIKIIKVNEDKEEKPFYELYDKEKYIVDNERYYKTNNKGEYPLLIYKNSKSESLDSIQVCIENNNLKSFVDTFEKFIGGAIIYPLPLLEDYVKDYKTIEGRMFDKQQNISYLAVAIAILGLIISLLIPQCSDTKIDDEQFSIILKGLENIRAIPK